MILPRNVYLQIGTGMLKTKRLSGAPSSAGRALRSHRRGHRFESCGAHSDIASLLDLFFYLVKHAKYAVEVFLP